MTFCFYAQAAVPPTGSSWENTTCSVMKLAKWPSVPPRSLSMRGGTHTESGGPLVPFFSALLPADRFVLKVWFAFLVL